MFAIDLKTPTLETDRLILRGYGPADFERIRAMWQDPVVRRHFHGKPLSREDSWGRFLRSLGMWAACGYGPFAVEEKLGGDFVGIVGAFLVKREMTPRIDDIPEVGWTLASQFHGRGYATEAAQAVLRWLDERFDRPETFCIVAPANTPSIRVAEKCGFRPSGETIYEGERTLVFRRRLGTMG